MKTNNINFIAIDIGSSKICTLASDLKMTGEARIGYQGVYRSSGLKSGVVKNFTDVENSIVNSIYNLEKSLDSNINSVHISISGAGMKSLFIYQKLRLQNAKVSKEDIKKLTTDALRKFEDSDLSVIHFFPIEYTLDQNGSIHDPSGMFGSILGVRLHIVVCESSQISNMLSCFSKCHIKVKKIIASPYASALSVLTEDEKNLGSMVIDFGATSTSYVIFSAGKPVYIGYVRVGSDHITNDISQVLSIPHSTAEKLKVMYGSSSASNSDSENFINISDVESVDNVNTENNISSKELTEIISARCEEIIDLIKVDYDKVGIDHLIGRRIILTGGGSQLRGLKEMVSSCFNKHVRIGYPVNIPGFEIDHSTPSYSSAVGIVKCEMINLRKNSIFSIQNSNLFERFTSWFKS